MQKNIVENVHYCRKRSMLKDSGDRPEGGQRQPQAGEGVAAAVESAVFVEQVKARPRLCSCQAGGDVAVVGGDAPGDVHPANAVRTHTAPVEIDLAPT